MKVADNKKKVPLRKGRRLDGSDGEIFEDVNILGNPMSVGLDGVHQLLKAVAQGTEQFQEILKNECSLIYECRVCRNLFRSVANFISHKRNFCKQQYRYFSHGFFNDQFDGDGILETASVDLDGKNGVDKNETDDMLDIARHKNEQTHNHIAGRHLSRLIESPTKKKMRAGEGPMVCRLESVPESNNAVYQTLVREETEINSIKSEVNELLKRSQPKEVTLLPNGTVEQQDIEKQHECTTCNTAFPSLRSLQRHKTLFHMKRKCYPCPMCKMYFATPWIAYRHLSKVHHKTEEQMRRLRPAVLNKASMRELYQPPRPGSELPASFTGRTEEEKWIAQYQGEQLHCPVCRKSFSRLATLAVHSNKCKLPPPASEQSKPEKQEPENLICSKCKKTFSRRAVWTTHTQTCSGPNALFTCRVCGRIFPRRKPLLVHMERCSQTTTRSPLRNLLTPPKLTPAPVIKSPSTIQVRREYLKVSPPIIYKPSRPLPEKLEAVVRKLHQKPPVLVVNPMFNGITNPLPNGSRIPLSACPEKPSNTIAMTMNTLSPSRQVLIQPAPLNGMFPLPLMVSNFMSSPIRITSDPNSILSPMTVTVRKIIDDKLRFELPKLTSGNIQQHLFKCSKIGNDGLESFKKASTPDIIDLVSDENSGDMTGKEVQSSSTHVSPDSSTTNDKYRMAREALIAGFKELEAATSRMISRGSSGNPREIVSSSDIVDESTTDRVDTNHGSDDLVTIGKLMTTPEVETLNCDETSCFGNNFNDNERISESPLDLLVSRNSGCGDTSVNDDDDDSVLSHDSEFDVEFPANGEEFLGFDMDVDDQCCQNIQSIINNIELELGFLGRLS